MRTGSAPCSISMKTLLLLQARTSKTHLEWHERLVGERLAFHTLTCMAEVYSMLGAVLECLEGQGPAQEEIVTVRKVSFR